MLVDSHSHLDFKDFAEDLDVIVARAEAAGVGRIVTISTRVKRQAELLAIAERFPNVYCSVGTHPHNADEEDGIPTAELIERTRHPKVVALGEAGLDYFYQHGSREAQARGFRTHIAAARATGLPLVIHTRDADHETFPMLERARVPVVLHCFSSPQRLDEAAERGYLLSFAGNVTYPKAVELQQAAARVPDDLLLAETDSPFLAPVPLRGRPNSPANVLHTLAFLAGLRGVDAGSLGELIERNAARVFGLP
jgi:TatD DNase family protein